MLQETTRQQIHHANFLPVSSLLPMSNWVTPVISPNWVGIVPVRPWLPYEIFVVEVDPAEGNLESSIQPQTVPIELLVVTAQS